MDNILENWKIYFHKIIVIQMTMLDIKMAILLNTGEVIWMKSPNAIS